jgi:hypothetical protein
VTNLSEKPFALIGVHIGGASAKLLKAVMEKEKITWRSFVDAGNAGAGPIAKTWNVSATPTLYLLDENRVIRYKWAGAPGEGVINAALARLIAAAKGNGKNSKR